MSAATESARGPRIVVVGSINMDLVARVRRLPEPGQTVHGESFAQIPGGKGANQAVAAARLGAECAMVGRVGDDQLAAPLRDQLAGCGVSVERVAATADTSSGVALISVEQGGENAIVIVAGANGRLTPADIAAAEGAIEGADGLLVQMEIPPETVEAAVAAAGRHGVRAILDPAPAPERVAEPLFRADVWCPNRAEAEAITGLAVTDAESAGTAALWLAERGVGLPVITLGAEGAILLDEAGEAQRIPSPAVRAVDATAAGDAFAGALAVALGRGRAAPEAVRYACAAGALAASREGAQPGMPDRAAVDAALG